MVLLKWKCYLVSKSELPANFFAAPTKSCKTLSHHHHHRRHALYLQTVEKVNDIDPIESLPNKYKLNAQILFCSLKTSFLAYSDMLGLVPARASDL